LATQRFWISLGAATVGAVVGAELNGVVGAVVGAAIASVTPFALDWCSERSKLKRKIVRVLSQSHPNAIAIRDVMRVLGIAIPVDCFVYDVNDSFIRSLEKYRAAFTELECEHRIVHSKQASCVVGYVDSPNEWVNEWAGRAYQQVLLQHH